MMLNVRPCIAVATALTIASSSFGQSVAKPSEPPKPLSQAAAVSSGPFRDTAALESAWKAGVSTAQDVRRLVGSPNGQGNFVGIVDYRPFELWFYDDIAVLEAKAVPDSKLTTMDMKMRQQFLMVFFRDERYQGHMWFSNDNAATAWIR